MRIQPPLLVYGPHKCLNTCANTHTHKHRALLPTYTNTRSPSPACDSINGPLQALSLSPSFIISPLPELSLLERGNDINMLIALFSNKRVLMISYMKVMIWCDDFKEIWSTKVLVLCSSCLKSK